MSPHEALSEAVQILGGQSATGRELGVSQAAVWRWLADEKPVPAEHVIPLETATGVSRYLLRPDIYPREDTPAQPPAVLPSCAAGGSSSPLDGVRT